MVLWEMTAITAYFLGLKRTYRLALRLQRRLVGPNHPRIRHFLYRRTRSIFDVAVKVHKNIQQRDIEVGRNLGNWILRWLHRMKPSAQIRPSLQEGNSTNKGIPKHMTSSQQFGAQKDNDNSTKDGSKGRVLFTALNTRTNYFPSTSMMTPTRKFTNLGGQYRDMSYSTLHASTLEKRRDLLKHVFRNDIAQWILR